MSTVRKRERELEREKKRLSMGRVFSPSVLLSIGPGKSHVIFKERLPDYWFFDRRFQRRNIWFFNNYYSPVLYTVPVESANKNPRQGAIRPISRSTETVNKQPRCTRSCSGACQWGSFSTRPESLVNAGARRPVKRAMSTDNNIMR